MGHRAWFDKLTMREVEDCRELYSATHQIGLATNHLPHGELVEPRTTNHANAAYFLLQVPQTAAMAG